jgi:hypothetical protein
LPISVSNGGLIGGMMNEFAVFSS